MNSQDTQLLEPEQAALDAPAPARFDFNRRDFFKTLGRGVMILYLAPAALAQQRGGGRGGRGGGAAPAEISAWIHIGEDGTVTVFTGKAEVGQNIRTSLTQAVAEELRVPPSSIKMQMADTDLCPYDAGTFGSQTTPQMAPRLHRAAAAARGVLLDMATEHFQVDRATLTVADGKISKTGGGESVTFGQLTKGQKFTKSIDASTPITPAGEWKIAGTSLPKVDGRSFVTGKHKYSSDLKLPGMLYGKVLRGPTLGAKMISVDTKAAEAMDGVKVVHDGNFVGVVAPDTLQAEYAIAAITAEWSAPSEQPTDKTIFEYIKNNVVTGGGRGGARRGGGTAETAEPVAAATGTTGAETPPADQTLKQTYNIAYIAHVPLEPRAAVADWQEDKLTVWAGTQSPFGVRSGIAQALGIPAERVRVITPDTGSGYGGKHTNEAAAEAARLSRGCGKPVKLVWTREEEFTWAWFRPANVIEITSGVNHDGTLVSWDYANYSAGNFGNSGLPSPYLKNQKSAAHPTRSPLRTASYRGLDATANHFAREVHMDELARLVKLDPLEFRLKNLNDSSADKRLKAVLVQAAETFGWGKVKPSGGRGYGIAGGAEKGSYVATCVEVMADTASGTVKVVRAVTAFECGAVVNPNHLKNQVEGAMMMGLGGALFEAVEFEKGMITNPHLADYRVGRFSDSPKIEIVLIDRKDIPSAGAGETPIMSIAPAIASAIFDATQIRLRNMPMIPDGLKA